MTHSTSEISSFLKKFNLTEEDCNKEVSNSHLDKISSSSCEKWRWLPHYLEMADIVSKDSDRNHAREDEKRRDFFCEWKQKKGFSATYMMLIGALLKIGCKQDAASVCRLLNDPAAKVPQLLASEAAAPQNAGQPQNEEEMSKLCVQFDINNVTG